MKTFGAPLPGKEYTVRPGVYAVITNDAGGVAIVQTGEGYFLPGGGLEENEAHEDCLKRELLEELGWQIAVGEHIVSAQRYLLAISKKNYYLSIAHFYRATKITKVAESVEPDHHLVWLTPEQSLSKLYHEHQAWGVACYFDPSARGE